MTLTATDDLWNVDELEAIAARNRVAREEQIRLRSIGQDKGGVLVTRNGTTSRVHADPEDYPVGTPRRSAPQRPRFDDRATEPMVAYLAKALVQKMPELSAEVRTTIIRDYSASKLRCHEILDELSAMPFPKRPRPATTGTSFAPLPDVPEGRYAVETEAGHLAFYSVDRPTEGRWAGYVFVKVWASSEQHPIPGMAAKRAILEKIAVDPKAAMLRFGREIGKCGHCGRTLTDADSREAGIGPICAAKVGF